MNRLEVEGVQLRIDALLPIGVPSRDFMRIGRLDDHAQRDVHGRAELVSDAHEVLDIADHGLVFQAYSGGLVGFRRKAIDRDGNRPGAGLNHLARPLGRQRRPVGIDANASSNSR